jgi:predicted MFS family arabinose efflux permease
VVISGAFLGAAALEASLSAVIGRLSDRRGPLAPVRVSLVFAVAVAVLIPFVAPSAVLVGLLVIGLPAFGVLFVPASAMISDGADRRRLHQGLAFGLANLAWAAGQGLAAASSGALAQATDDAFPFALLAAVFLATALALRPSGRRLLARLGVPGPAAED